MPYGRTSYMNLVGYSTGYVDQVQLSGAIAYVERPQALDPQWLVIVSDAGEIRVFDQLGVHQAGYDVDAGFTPDEASINNENPPRVLLRRASTLGIYCYRSGALEWSVAGIVSLVGAKISGGYIHTLLSTGVAGTTGPEWRSLADGSLLQASYGADLYTNAMDIDVTEAGEIVYWLNTNATSHHVVFYKTSKDGGNLWSVQIQASAAGASSGQKVRCAADGSLIIVRSYHSWAPLGWIIRLYSNSMVLLYNVETGSSNDPVLHVNPAGTRAMYATRLAAPNPNVLHKFLSDGTHTTVNLGGVRASNFNCVDLSDDPFFSVLLSNGDLEVYDDSLVKRATLDYGLSDGPIAVI